MNVQNRMDQRLDRRDFKNFIPSSPEEAKYYEATKRVKKIKGFYTHALVYVVINIVIVILNIKNLNPGESYFKLENFSVFLPNFIFGQDWEEKKMKQFMEEEKKKSWQ